MRWVSKRKSRCRQGRLAFFELTTASSEPNLAKLGGFFTEFKDKALCWFFSRTVGSCEKAEATEGRERRPRPLEVSLLSPVVPVEVLADEECIRSVLDVGDSLRRLSSPVGTQRGSFLKGWSMAVYVLDIEYYLHQNKISGMDQKDFEQRKKSDIRTT